MKIKTIFIVLVLSLISCTGTKKLPVPEIKPEIPLDILNERGIAVMNPRYKRSYFRIMPYLFYNNGAVFNEIRGDFYNLNYGTTSNFNIMSGFWSDYGEYENSLIVLIALTNSSSIPLKDLSITVASSKNGIFEKGKLRGNVEINKKQQRILFVKRLNVRNPSDILDKIDDDVIKVTIENQEYEFLNPEIQL